MSVWAHRQGVYVPEMCVELTTRRVLVMEWVDGVRLRSAASGSALPRGRDDLRLVEIGVHCSLEQVRWLLKGLGLWGFRKDLRLVKIGVHCSLAQVPYCRPAVWSPSQ